MHTYDQGSSIRTDIQVLRALAVLAVVICHMNPGWLPGGYLGVDIFFVISGFVITQAYVNGYSQKGIATFWLVRLFRIVPAYIAMLFLTAFVAAVLFPAGGLNQFGKSWISGLLFFSNSYFANYGDYFSPEVTEQPLLHTWSLAVEMQFYLIYPLLLKYVNRSRSIIFLGVLAIAGFAMAQIYWTYSETPSKLYYSLLIRMPEFLMGAMLVFASPKLDNDWLTKNSTFVVGLGLAIFLFSIFYISEDVFSPQVVALVCVGGALVIFGGRKSNCWDGLLKNQAFSKIGSLSYSIYLWHWPLLAFYRYAFGPIAWSVYLCITYVLSVLLLAAISYGLIENKFRYKANDSVASTSLKISIVAILAVSPVLFAKPVNAMIPSMPIQYTRYANDAEICHGRILSNCIQGVEGGVQYLLIGDSHAAQLNIAANKAGHSLNASIEVLSASSCVPLPKFNVDKLPSWAKNDCRTQITAVSKKLGSNKNIILAGMWSYQFQDSSFANALRDFLKSETSRGSKVLVLGQIPKLTKNPSRMVRMKYFGIDTPIIVGVDWKDANLKLNAIINEFPSVKYFDPAGDLIFASPPYYDQFLIYSDDHHLNEVGAAYYGPVLARQIQNSF